MSRSELVSLTNDEVLTDRILKVVEDVSDYAHFQEIAQLGLQIHHSEFDFDKVMLFSWIRNEVERVKRD